MGLQEAKADLIKNYSELWVVKTKEGDVWRTTLAGTPWIKYRWGQPGYKEGQLRYELHVHGSKAYKVTEEAHDSKVCGENLKGGQAWLSSGEWRLIAAKVKELANQKK